MYVGPPIDDDEILDRVTAAHRNLLMRTNGYVAYDGGLHVRGACVAPAWHSLRAAWEGPDAIHRLFPVVAREDIPFAQEALGDQFLVRDEIVHRLHSETGDLESLDVDLVAFDRACREDPVEYLQLQPLVRFRADGGELEPGQLLSAYPPFCAVESVANVSLRAIPAIERLRFLAELSEQIRRLPRGAKFRIDVVE
ncbi:MAG TPA: hypothetical protein VJO33_11600 [Gemmatimonadaceae bacterium]|nr:hypothetical protein [Gemmatimonadaceae bacterium]